MNKRKIITLSIGLTVIAASFIASILYVFCFTTYTYSGEDAFIYLFFVLPAVLEVVSFVRSTYKLINFKPAVAEAAGLCKACCIVSIVIALVGLAFLLLVFTGVISDATLFPNRQPGSISLNEVLFFVGWPLFFVSFIFGSIP